MECFRNFVVQLWLLLHIFRSLTHAGPPVEIPAVTDVYGDSGTFLSPNYPSKYPSNQDITYTAHLSTSGPLFLQVLFNVQLENVGNTCIDYIKIHETKYCGSGTAEKEIRVNGTLFVMTFYSDNRIEENGFNVTFKLLSVISTEDPEVATTSNSAETTTVAITESEAGETKTSNSLTTDATDSPSTTSTTRLMMTTAEVTTGKNTTLWTDHTGVEDSNSESGEDSKATSQFTEKITLNTGEDSITLPTTVGTTEIIQETSQSAGTSSQGFGEVATTLAGQPSEETTLNQDHTGDFEPTATGQNTNVTPITQGAQTTENTLNNIDTQTVTPVSASRQSFSTNNEVTPISKITSTPKTFTQRLPSDRPCCCKFVTKDMKNNKLAEHEKKLAAMVKALTVEKGNVSIIRRRYISVPDHRTSAKAIGMVGIVLCALPVLFMLMTDLMGMCSRNTIR